MSEEFKCDNCGEDKFESARQLQGHKMTCKPRHEKEEKREERVSFGQAKLSYNAPKNDGYSYHVFNDNWRYDPDRIERAERTGWVRSPDSKVSGRNRGTNEDGSGIVGVLMRIPKELFDKDQEAMIKETEKIDEQIRAGRFTQQANEKRYSPSGGITIDN